MGKYKLEIIFFNHWTKATFEKPALPKQIQFLDASNYCDPLVQHCLSWGSSTDLFN